MAIYIVLVIVIVTALTLYFRKASQTTEYDNSYSVLHREATQQLQPQSLHPANDNYDHIQLSPSTGQAEFISKTERDNTNNPSPRQGQNSMYHSVDTEQPKSATCTMQITAASSIYSPSHKKESTNGQPTYAVVNKQKKQKKEKEPVHCQPKTSAATSLNLTKQNSTDKNIHSQPVENVAKAHQLILYNQEIQENNRATVTKYPSQTAESPEELYTAVRKKTKESTAENEEEPPPIPPQGVEQLYTAVNKKTQSTAANDEVESPPIPPHTVEELYTAVMKKPKARETDDEVEAPPVLPNKVDELYTGVQKNKN